MACVSSPHSPAPPALHCTRQSPGRAAAGLGLKPRPKPADDGNLSHQRPPYEEGANFWLGQAWSDTLKHTRLIKLVAKKKEKTNHRASQPHWPKPLAQTPSSSAHKTPPAPTAAILHRPQRAPIPSQPPKRKSGHGPATSRPARGGPPRFTPPPLYLSISWTDGTAANITPYTYKWHGRCSHHSTGPAPPALHCTLAEPGRRRCWGSGPGRWHQFLNQGRPHEAARPVGAERRQGRGRPARSA